MSTLEIILLAVLTAAAVLRVRAAARMVAPGLAGGQDDAALAPAIDVWLPIVLIVPAVLTATRMMATVNETGGISITIGATAPAVVLGAVLLARPHARPADRPVMPTTVIVGLCGVVVLFLAMMDRMTLGVGQTAVAAGIVLLWFNTPEVKRGMSDGPVDPIVNQMWLGIIVMLVAATVQTIVLLSLGGAALMIAGGVMAIEMACVLAVFAARAEPASAVRIGMWIGSYGTLGAVGVASLSHVFRASVPFATGESSIPMLQLQYGVVRGFSAYAAEGAMLVIAALLVVVCPAEPGWIRRALGAVLIVGPAVLLGVRLAG